jgi:hypothetical protein
MSVQQHASSTKHLHEEGFITLGVIGFVFATGLMGWCLFGHQRPNMPRAEIVQDIGSPR